MTKEEYANQIRDRAYRRIELAHELADPFLHESALRMIDKAERIEKEKL